MLRMISIVCLAALLALPGIPGAFAQDSTFTYQGRLEYSGEAYTGSADLTFRLYDQVAGGSQVGPTLSRAGWPVSDGLFQVELDFGAAAFDGQARYLEVVVDGTALSPRQAVRPAPVALFALAGNEGPQGPPGASPFTLDESTGAIEYQYLNQLFRFAPNANPDWPPSIVAGHADNQAGLGAVVAGGGEAGDGNVASGTQAVVSGGGGNLAAGLQATVSGGKGNTAGTDRATVGGGVANNASGTSATIAGGGNNSAEGTGSAVGGGAFNSATANYTFIGGGASSDATGAYATVGGGSSHAASGERSTIAGGEDHIASGYGATVGGGGSNTASGAASTISGGANNVASSAYSSVGGGSHNHVSGWNAVISGGESNLSTGLHTAVGGGWDNAATANYAAVIGGWSNTASGEAATVAGGSGNCAGGYSSLAAGHRAKVRPGTESGSADQGCDGVSDSGTSYGDAGTFVWADSQDADFISTGSDQFLIRAGGGVGINTDAPAVPLHVMGASPSSVFDGQLRLQGDEDSGAAETGAAISFAGHDGSIARVWGAIRSVKENSTVGNPRSVMRFYTRATGSLVERMRIDSNGVTYNGSGSWSTFSDRRLKKNIGGIERPLERLLALEGVRFEYRDPEQVLGAEGPRLGFIAQQVEEVFPEWVGENEDGYKHVTPSGFEALTVEALREVEMRRRDSVARLEARLQAQEERAERLEGQLARQAEAIELMMATNRELSSRNAELTARLTESASDRLAQLGSER